MAKFELYAQVDVPLSGHCYSIDICQNGLSNAENLQNYVVSQQALIVTNETIAPLYLNQLQAHYCAIQCDVVILPDGEQFKNQASLFAIYDALIKHKHHRDTTLIALGGGVIGDITGFAASTYQRGAHFLQIPTTLLAQVDASVGGKTAINHAMGKNMVGSFYQPCAVLIDLATLKTLPEREFRAGLAEIIKYGLLVGGVFLDDLTDVLKNGLSPNSTELPALIARCCKIKADYVVADEKEQGLRALLNLGHTVAHALESYTDYKEWLHGEAVAIGLYCAALLSYHAGLTDASLVTRVEQLLNYAQLPHKIPKFIDIAKLKQLMMLDKKIKNNCLRFIVIKKPGDCAINDSITAECLDHTLNNAVSGD